MSYADGPTRQEMQRGSERHEMIQSRDSMGRYISQGNQVMPENIHEPQMFYPPQNYQQVYQQ